MPNHRFGVKGNTFNHTSTMGTPTKMGRVRMVTSWLQACAYGDAAFISVKGSDELTTTSTTGWGGF
jgi:hypothetical protein